MKKITLLLFTFLSLLLGADEQDSAAFLKRARHSGSGRSYGIMEGILQHKKSGKALEEFPISLTVLIHDGKADARLILDGHEGYEIRQSVQEKVFAVPGKMAKMNMPVAQYTGLNPSDLTAGFLFYDLKKEEPPRRVLGIPCRVMILASPDKKEFVKVYLAQAYAFTLKAEFFNSENDLQNNMPKRTLEVGSFQKGENDLYYAELINIYGNGWRTRIQFPKEKVTLGIADDQTGRKIFRNTEGKL